MACNCNNADPNCEPCAICTPPGVTGLTTCEPVDPCDKKLDIGCAIYNGDDYPCLGVVNGNSLFSTIFSLLSAVFPNCCNIGGTVIMGNPNLTTTTTTLTPTTTSTTIAPSTTSTTTVSPCSFFAITNTGPISSTAIVNYVPCNTTGYVPLNITTSQTVCVNTSYPIVPVSGTVTAVNSGACNTPAIPTTTSTTAFSCTCQFYDVSNVTSTPFSFTYTACNNGYQVTSGNVPGGQNIRVCACNDILNNNVPKGVTITPTGINCSSQPSLLTSTTTIAPTTTTPCKCFYVTAKPGTPISWVDCNGVTQTGTYSSASPYYCSQSSATFEIVGFSTITGGTALCVNGLCPATTTTTIVPSTTTSTTRCVPACGAIYTTTGNNNLYFYNLINPTLGISTRIPNPTSNPIPVYGGIAHTGTKFFISDNVGDPLINPTTAFARVAKYDFNSCPISFTNPVLLTASAGVHALGLTAKDANTLITVRNRSGLSSLVIELDVSGGSTITSTDKFSLNTVSVRILTGDLYWTSNDVLYTTQRNSAGTANYLTTYTYSTGTQIAEVNIDAIAATAYGLAAIGNTIYIFNSTGAIYRVDSMAGSGTFTRMPDGFANIGSASTAPGCSLPTTTTTAPPTTSTTTLACNCLTFVSSNSLSATYTYTDCFGKSASGTIGAFSTLSFCGVPGSATFSRGSITATTGLACPDKVTCTTGPTTTTIAPTTSTTVAPTTTTTKTPTTTTIAPTSSTTSTTTKTPTTTTTTVAPTTTSSTTNPFVNKYLAETYSCFAPNGCLFPVAVELIVVTVANNTLVIDKFYQPVGEPTGYVYKVKSVTTGTAAIALNKLTENITCGGACSTIA
jgi:hypothetical protein